MNILSQILLGALFCGSIVTASSGATASPPRPGTVLIVGGGATPEPAVRTFIRAAGGENVPIMILAQSQEEAVTGAPESATMFREWGAKNVEAPVGIPAAEIIAKLSKARGVWIPGGDQNRFVAVFPESSGVPAAIREVWKRGGVVGGTSAGASLMGSLMPTGADTTVEGVKAGACPVAAGLAVLPKTIVDQHFFVRNRLQRLLTAILEHPGNVGIGLDERAWITIHNGKLNVGAGQVALLQLKSAAKREGSQLGSENIHLRILLTGASVLLP